MSTFVLETTVRRPLAEVLDFLRDGRTMPAWFEAVTAVRPLAGSTDGRERFEVRRRLPSGDAVNVVELSVETEPIGVLMRSRRGPTPFAYRFELRPDGPATRVTLDGSITAEGLSGPFALLAPVAGKLFERGMAENLRTLRRRLEMGGS